MQKGINSMKHYHIVADAAPISEDLATLIGKQNHIIALDGAANTLYGKWGIKPKLIIGDLDSINSDTLNKAIKEEIVIIKKHLQNQTDMEKAIEYCCSNGAKSITIYNAFGGRVDHSLYNLRMLRRYNSIPITMISHDQIMTFIRDRDVVLEGKAGEIVSIMAFPSALLYSKGLTYEMQAYKLEFAERESVSNSMAQAKANIKISGDALIITSRNIVLK